MEGACGWNPVVSGVCMLLAACRRCGVNSTEPVGACGAPPPNPRPSAQRAPSWMDDRSGSSGPAIETHIHAGSPTSATEGTVSDLVLQPPIA